MSLLDRALADVDIFQIWVHLGLRGKPARSCKSPFRQDRNPSFSIYENRCLWRDHGTGEGGDVIAFIAKAKGTSRSDACRWLIDYHLVRPADPQQSLEALTQSQATKELGRKPTLPPQRACTPDECRAIAESRGVDVEAVLLAMCKGCLTVCDIEGHPAWVITDSRGFNAQARRIDGRRWPAGGKVKGFRDNVSKWPIGIQEAQEFDAIVLVEGTPDFLAAYHFLRREGRVDQVAPVCLTGASMEIHPEALPGFRGKTTRIMAHNDPAGQRAAERWTRQLQGVAHRIEVFDLKGLVCADGRPVKDLNDLCLVDPACPDPRLTAVTKF